MRYETESSEAFEKAVQASLEAGVVHVVAAGNQQEPVKDIPANYPGVITVSSVADYDGKPGGEAEPTYPLGKTCEEVAKDPEQTLGADDTLSIQSNYGPLVDVAAPGVCIYSTAPSNQYLYASGTSMASPHVAGAAALLAANHQPENLEDVEAIRNTIVKAGNFDWENIYSWGATEEGEPDEVQEPLLDVHDESVFGPNAKSSTPALEPPGASFPASFSLAGEPTVRLRGGSYPITCKTESGVKALSGEGSFESATEGTAALSLHNCRESSFNSKCTTSGQSSGTIATEALPFRLAYLSDGEPGLLLLPNASSGTLTSASCVGGFLQVKVKGSGVLGRITKPALGEASETLSVDFNAPEAEGGGYVQQYTETEAGLSYGLQVTVNGGEAKAAALEADPTATFAGGKGKLVAG